MKRLLVALLLIYPLSASADTYQWTDDRGTVNFTEDYGKVPKKYRKKMKVQGDDDGAAPQSSVSPEPEMDKPKPEEAEPGKKLYGGKDERVWRRDFDAAAYDLQSAEAELEALHGRLKDTSRMSRSEYLAIQNTLKHAESRVQGMQRKLDLLRETADRYGVPMDFRR